MSDAYVSIHSHTDGSVLDSPVTVDKLLDTIKEIGQPAAAITDHGSMINVVDWYKGCKQRDLKPLLGMETYVTYEGIANKDATKMAKTDSTLAIDSGILGIGHLVLLARNETGFHNLCRLSAIAHTEGYYYQPRIDYDILEKHKEGLIVSTACMFGDFSKMVDRGEFAKAERFAGKMVEMFGDDFYIELQNHGFEAQHRYVPKAMEIAKKVGANLIVTQDVHYAKKDDWMFQDALFCIGKHQDYTDPKRRTACKEMYVKTRAQMEAAMLPFGVPAIALDNSLNIMNKIENYELAPKDYLLPKFLGTKQLADNKLKELSREGWKIKLQKKIGTDLVKKAVYGDRVNYELSVITAMGFSDYFLIVQDFIGWARAHGIRVGPGRGSAAGCLVSYLLGITNIDPIEYNLLFERFLVPGRPTMPDIDVDVSDRDAVVAYLEEKYGRDKVSPILNRTTVTAKAALVKVASILGDYKLGQDISALIKKVRGETPSFSEVLSDVAELQIKKSQYPKLFELAEGLEGVTMSLSGHASGIVVSPIPISEVVPLHHSKDHVYTAYDKDQLSYVKLTKFDILGVDAQSTIKNCVALIKERYKTEVDIDDVPVTEVKVWELIRKADTIGVFQFESVFMKDILKRFAPTSITELAVVNAIGRPGAMDNPGLIDAMIKRKHGLEPITYAHPVLEPILANTYGFIVFQEQLMKVAQVIAGFTIEEADQLRKGTADKKVEIIEKMRSKYIDGAIKNGYPKELAEHLFEQTLLFAGYGFNLSHSIAYSYVAYQTAWLKCYYPLEYLVSCMNTQVGKAIELQDITKFVMDLEYHGFTIKSPDVMKSIGRSFVIDDTELDTNGKPVVYYCLGALKGVSPDQVDEWLKLKPFKDMDDAVIKAVVTGCSSKNLSVLAAVGAFDRIAPNTPYVISSLPNRLEEVKKAVNRLKSKAKRQEAKLIKQRAANTMELGLGLPPAMEIQDWTQIAQYGFDMGDGFELLATPLDGAKFDRIKQEMQYIGYAVSGTLLDEYEVGVRRKADMTPTWWVSHTTEGSRTKVAGIITVLTPKTDRNNRKMAFATISDGRSDIRVVIFASLFGQFQGTSWKVNKAIVVDGRRDKDGLVAEDITFLRKDSDAKQANYKEDTGPNF